MGKWTSRWHQKEKLLSCDVGRGLLQRQRGEIVLESVESERGGTWIEGPPAVADVQCRRAYGVVVVVVVVDFLSFFHSWTIMKDFVPVPRLSIRSPCSLHLKDSWRFQIAPPTNRVTFLYHGKKKCESGERERDGGWIWRRKKRFRLYIGAGRLLFFIHLRFFFSPRPYVCDGTWCILSHAPG